MTLLQALTNATRVFIVVVFIVPLVLFGLKGFPFSVLFGYAAWLMGVVALYGPRVMVHEHPPLRTVAWKHITFWYDDPEALAP